ncbi:hypothetical protein [Bacillus cereus]|nr:hypothetical protein [Bacillus cereus]
MKANGIDGRSNRLKQIFLKVVHSAIKNWYEKNKEFVEAGTTILIKLPL